MPHYEQESKDYMAEVIQGNQDRRAKSVRQLDVSAPRFSEQAEMERQVKAVDKANRQSGKVHLYGRVQRHSPEVPPWEQETETPPWEASQETPPWETSTQPEIVPPEGSQAPSRGIPAAQRIPGFEGIKDALTPRTTLDDVLTPSYLGNVALGGTAGFALGGPAGAVVGGSAAILAHEGYKREIDKWKSMGYTAPGEAEQRASISSGMLGMVDMLAFPHTPQGVGGAYTAGEFARRHMPPPETPPNPLNTTQTRQLYPSGYPATEEFVPPSGPPQPSPGGGAGVPTPGAVNPTFQPTPIDQTALYPGTLSPGRPQGPVPPRQLDLGLPWERPLEQYVRPLPEQPGASPSFGVGQSGVPYNPLIPPTALYPQPQRLGDLPSGQAPPILPPRPPQERPYQPGPPGGQPPLSQPGAVAQPFDPNQLTLPFGKVYKAPTPQEVSQATKTITFPPEPVLGTEPVAKVAPKWKRWWEENVRFHFGMDRHVVEAVPNSPVFTAVESAPVWNETKLQALMEDTPWVKKILHPKGVSPLKQWLSRKQVREEAETWLDEEDRAVNIWKQGGKTQGAYDAAIKSLSPEQQERVHFDDLLFEQVNAINKKWDQPLIPRLEGPYFRHQTSQEFRELRSVQQKGGAGLGSGMGGRRSERQFETQREGERVIGQKGYVDPRAAWLAKVHQDYNLIHLDKVMDSLVEKGVLHRTKDAALAASPTGEPMRVSLGVFDPPGGWWVRTREEAQFLRQNFTPAKDQLHFTKLANMFFRGPNLVDPYPHIVKNMGEKLLLTTIVNKKSLADVPKDMLSWKHNSEPGLIQAFKDHYPMTHSGKSSSQLIEEAIPQGIGDRTSQALELLNNPSRKEIFARWDPAMRYAIWRGYVRKGMSYQEAANHTFLDLIRYGRRGYMEDLWKSIPMNMFIPWRVGVLSTLNKAFKTAPFRTLGVLGAIEVIREADYRANDRFFHLPHDYLMTPALEATSGKYGEALETLVASAFAGPGGAQAIRSIETMLQDMQGRGQGADIGKLLWGLKQVYDIGTSYEDFMRTGEVKPVADMIGLLLLGRHAVPYGPPKRLGQFIPESILPKSAATQQSERKGRQARGEEPRGTGLPNLRIPQ